MLWISSIKNWIIQIIFSLKTEVWS